MNKLSADRRTAIIHALCEGNSIRATARMTGANKETVMKLLASGGSRPVALRDGPTRSAD